MTMNLITTTTMNSSINTGEIIGHIQSMAYENQMLKQELSDLKGKKLDAGRFYAVAVNIETVATLHNVHPDTVRKYVKLGLIEKHPDSMDAKILIRASDALLLDFTELKKQYRLRHYSKNQPSGERTACTLQIRAG